MPQFSRCITVAIVFGVILALALRGIADNFAAGIVLQTRRPIHIGDEVESLGYVGNVLEMDGRAVVIETFDGRTGPPAKFRGPG